jgi:hypothetical protein
MLGGCSMVANGFSSSDMYIHIEVVGRSRDRSPVVSLRIFSEANDGTMCPGVDSASKNEYQENFWE